MAEPEEKAGTLSWPASLIALAALVVQTAAPGSLAAQDVHAVSSGAVQSVRAGVSQNVRAGAIARNVGGERAGVGGFAVSEGTSRVGSGRVSGYGARVGNGIPAEYVSPGGPGLGGNDFPASDFVATMPRPAIQGYSLATGPSAAGFGVSLGAVPVATVGRSHGPSHAVHHSLKNPDAILNPFTHTIGPSFGSVLPGGALKETVLGAPKIP